MCPRTLIYVALSLMLCLGASAPFAAAADYYVDGPNGDGLAEGGNDSNKGALESPWLTVNHGVQQLKPGDTLYIRASLSRVPPFARIPAGSPSWMPTQGIYNTSASRTRPSGTGTNRGS